MVTYSGLPGSTERLPAVSVSGSGFRNGVVASEAICQVKPVASQQKARGVAFSTLAGLGACKEVKILSMIYVYIYIY